MKNKCEKKCDTSKCKTKSIKNDLVGDLARGLKKPIKKKITYKFTRKTCVKEIENNLSDIDNCISKLMEIANNISGQMEDIEFGISRKKIEKEMEDSFLKLTSVKNDLSNICLDFGDTIDSLIKIK